MWRHGTNIESPADYKKRYRAAEVAEEEEGEPVEDDVEREKPVNFWSWIFGRRKRAGDNQS